MADQSTALLVSPHSDSGLKRKRESMDNGHPDNGRMTRPAHGPNGNGGMQGFDAHNLGAATTELSQIDQQLLEHVGQQNGVHDNNALAAKAALAAQAPQNKYPPPPDGSYDTSGMGHGLPFGDDVNQGQIPGVHNPNSTAAAVYAAREAQSMGSAKPAVGSPEWHQQRKNNHKEVERRRRETINEGINEIAKIVPGCEKNKGSILQRAIEHITELTRDRKAIQQGWEQEKMTTEAAINDISHQNTKLKLEVNRRGTVASKWIERCRTAGLKFDDFDDDLNDLGQIHIPGEDA